ncbi:four helix bundle protein [Gallionella capsiferriformans]|uniref:S23 ribosomal protein n=1 Tax=Gallionella capsiferriformans (strain ES-2) TaxID=395494 RepID=D9SJX5_GALCS|nr:four helix bundle protein [Gallionella capsiferriformans]ADL54474.1 S23 ribosomal protein [Gallionella capsiferriformans ES-2]
MKYSELIVWQKAMDLVTEIYKVTATFPVEERFGLSSQIRRAAVSVPSNIAEGHGRKSTASYLNFLSIAFGSLMELETQIQIAVRLDFIREDAAVVLLSNTDEIGKMLSGLKRSLAEKIK